MVLAVNQQMAHHAVAIAAVAECTQIANAFLAFIRLYAFLADYLMYAKTIETVPLYHVHK